VRFATATPTVPDVRTADPPPEGHSSGEPVYCRSCGELIRIVITSPSPERTVWCTTAGPSYLCKGRDSKKTHDPIYLKG
jgi:hypothetical protein